MQVFQMRCVLAAVLLCFSSFQVQASPHAACVQAQLKEAGHYAGAIDGALGRGTQAAAAAFRKETQGFPELPALDAENASVYCRALGVSRNSRTGWTSPAKLLSLTVGEETPRKHRRRISKIAKEADRFFRKKLGVSVPQSIEVYLSSSVQESARLTNAELRRQGVKGSIEKAFYDWCDGYGYCGMSYGGAVAISFSDAGGFPEANIREVIAHEAAHEVHGQYVGNFRHLGDTRQVRERGPKWLTEAAAGALGRKFRDPRWKPRDQVKHFKSRRQFSAGRLKSFKGQASAHQEDFQDYSNLAGALLEAKGSHKSFIAFWEKTPELGWEKAFAAAFGLTVAQFYREFDAL